ncbi:hypothetical protein ACFVXH_39670 [Kitasatospora sp. NPDC058184]|uniref:hypothetical protein n=1 Tax=Kitasatospora sp. NPDC058184 TaxID=3346370 RepID=UPI0036D993F7
MTTTAPITPGHFPTSPLALRTTDPDRQAPIRAFASEQAAAASTAATRIVDLWTQAGTHADRITALGQVHAELIEWRHRLALAAAGRLGQGLTHDPERFRTPITGHSANFDRIGQVGRLREGSVWDAATRTYTGGASTPAWEAMDRYGRAALARFTIEAPDDDELQNWITLPNGIRLAGNRLLRGAAARAAAEQLTVRVAARGLDASRMETGGQPLYTVTPDSEHSALLHQWALILLTTPAPTLQDYLTARYLMFQAPQTKKGSDSVTRVFVVAAGAVLFGDRAPALPADIDLRCYVLGQAAACRP